MRFNHMEMTFPIGTLTGSFREEIDAFYGSIFGWTALDTEVVGQSCHLLMPDPDQFILLAESERPMSSPGYDHLGLLQDSRQEVDDLLDACERYAEKDDRVQIKRYEDLVYPGRLSTPSTSSTSSRSTSTCRAWSTVEVTLAPSRCDFGQWRRRDDIAPHGLHCPQRERSVKRLALRPKPRG